MSLPCGAGTWPRATFEGAERNKALAIWGMMGAFGKEVPQMRLEEKNDRREIETP